ncbi:MAG: bifunctional DNA-formamidopyrimidine glycosylase/DNA-(apurinic or apyrimidinic site) lyase [Desulfobacteraceae bacterium]|jgi:formamidopyrimidine-DNA glycosylase
MPELPEVETIVNDLIQAGLIGVKIQKAKIYWQRSIAVPKAASFNRQIAGAVITNIFRRGKFIVFELAEKGNLLIHLRMSGRIIITFATEPRGKHEHVILTCDGARNIRLHDPRKFGRIYLVKDANEILGRLGPEPLAQNFKSIDLKQILQSHRRQLKPLLLDQRMLAGLGNIYVDEALWEASIHPLCLSHQLNDPQIKKLYAAIRRVLRRGLANRGTALGKGAGNFVPAGEVPGKNQHELRVFRKEGIPCLRCNEPIIRLVVGQRGTHICPACQILS